MNNVFLVGNVSQDPELKALENGTGVLKFNFATNKSWVDDKGEKQNKAEFHRIVVFGKRAVGLAPHIAKGDKLALNGEIRYGSYEKDGEKKYTTDIVVNDVEFCSSGKGKKSDAAEDDFA